MYIGIDTAYNPEAIRIANEIDLANEISLVMNHHAEIIRDLDLQIQNLNQDFDPYFITNEIRRFKQDVEWSHWTSAAERIRNLRLATRQTDKFVFNW